MRFLDSGPCQIADLGGGNMGFSGVRALVMVVILVVLVLAVTKLSLPGWILPVGLIASGVLVKSITINPSQQSASEGTKR